MSVIMVAAINKDHGSYGPTTLNRDASFLGPPTLEVQG